MTILIKMIYLINIHWHLNTSAVRTWSLVLAL